jgi:U32 family peptidase
MTKVGEITHYFDKIGVAVIKTVADLKVGAKIKFSGSADFSQIISSMQVNHQSIEEAKNGDEVGMKVDQPVKPGDEVYLLE